MNFSSLKKTLGKAYETAASTAATAAKDIQSQVVGARCLRDYTLQRQIASGGLHGLWKIYSARSKKEGAQNKVVGVWILDKRAPSSFGGGRWDSVIDLCRKEAAALARLKHPSIVKILEPMEESRTQVIMVTEAIFASSLDLLTKFSNVPGHRHQVKLSELDVKAGLLQIADGLQFLHHEANLVHRGISPGVVMLTESGAWKLAGLGLAVRAQFAGSNEAATLTFDFSNPSPPSALQLTQAPLAYVAPELIGRAHGDATSLVTPAADMFSLGALVYELVSGSQLFQVGNNVGDYQAKLASLHLMDLTGIPVPLQSTLKSMLNPQPSVRPNANAFTGAPYFQDDVVVRALRFLESFLQRDALQKASFLKDLEGLWSRCDARVLRYRVLPPLLAESRNEALQPVILPLIMKIVSRQESQALFQLIKFAEVLYEVMNAAAVSEVLIPLLCRGADHGDVRTQEEVLLKCQGLAEKADYATLKAQILPRCQRLNLATTSASVRQASFKAMTALAPRFDKEVASEFIATTQQVLRVDRSNGTVSGALGLGKALTTSWGPIFAAESVLPVLSPCLAAPGLSREQFRDVYKAVEDILHSIASSRANALEEERPMNSNDIQAASPESLPTWDTGPSVSGPTESSTTLQQPVHAPVPKRTKPASMRPTQNPTVSSSVAELATNSAQTDPFAMSWNANGVHSAQPLAQPAQLGSGSPAFADLPAGFQPVDVTHKSWMDQTAAPQQSSQKAQQVSGSSNPMNSWQNQQGLGLPTEDPDPFADWPPANQSSRLALAGISPHESVSNASTVAKPLKFGGSGNSNAIGLGSAAPSGSDHTQGSAAWPASSPNLGFDGLSISQNSGRSMNATKGGLAMGNAMNAPKLAPPPRSRSGQQSGLTPVKDPFSESLI